MIYLYISGLIYAILSIWYIVYDLRQTKKAIRDSLRELENDMNLKFDEIDKKIIDIFEEVQNG